MANGKCTRTWRGNSILVLLLYVTSTFRAVPGSGPACSSALGEGECVQTQQPSGSNCAAENTDENCPRTTGDPSALYDPEAAERQCPSHLPDTNTATAHALAQDLTVILYPIGRDKKFSLYVSWESNDPNTTGFYVWVYKCNGECQFNIKQLDTERRLPYYNRGTRECQLVDNANSRAILYNGAIHQTWLLECKDDRDYILPKCYSHLTMTVVVIPRPRPSDVTFSHYLNTSSVTVKWTDLSYCWATIINRNCSSPVVIRPVSDFNVTSSAEPGGLMDVHIVWTPSSDEDVEYIVTVTDVAISTVPNCTTPGRNPPCFVARHTTQVTISRLDISKEYSISVQVAPRCNGSSFAKHYVGCHSETCCESKRIRHIESNNSTQPPFPTTTTAPLSTPAPHTDHKATTTESMGEQFITSFTTVTTESMRESSIKSSITTDSRRESSITSSTTLSMEISTELSHDVRTDGVLRTMHQYSTSSITQSGTSIESTMIPPLDTTGDTKSGVDVSSGLKVKGVIIGVTVPVFLVIFVSCVMLVICYAKRRNGSRGRSIISASSLTNSLESSTEDGRYCNLMTIDHVIQLHNHAGNEASTDVCNEQSSMGSCESPVTQTFEIESLVDGAGSTSSEKLDGSLSLSQDDAFETSDKNRPNGSVPNSKENGEPDTCAKRPTHKTCGRSRSESASFKTSRTSSKRRPRSLSTPHTLQDSDVPNPPLSALILYSKGSPEEETKVIQQHLLHDLTQYNIRTVSEDTSMFRECPASWLETQMRAASAVFCVCNEAFDREWENKSDGLSVLVPVFKKLCHGLVTPSCGKNQLLHDKIAIVLPRVEDLHYVPAYINCRPKFRLLKEDLCKMARFVHGIPECQHSNNH